ncbi:MAG: helix-turn-helix transcriptional regulator, partial [Alphaproteobacteria bacterium]|nr:helix-turn-helix transcriptional regulator [Alphaproteobacteria bacterium]
HVGRRLKERRSLMGLSQEKLGAAVGLTFQQIQKYERGQNRIGASRLFELAEVLNVPVQFFFEGMADAPGLSDQPQEPFGENVAPDLLSRRETLELVRTYYRIASPELRRRALDVLRSLAEPKDQGS